MSAHNVASLLALEARCPQCGQSLATIGEDMRRSVELRMQDFKYREIAAVLGISIETVKAHLHQAQKRLKLTLRDPGGGGPEGTQ